MANDTIPTLQWLNNQIEKLDTDLLCQMLKVIAEFMMDLDANQRFWSDPRVGVFPGGDPRRDDGRHHVP